jgi:diguanylate cyclase (GGDEF)-like protein/PAS domain S-box-containing protein
MNASATRNEYPIESLKVLLVDDSPSFLLAAQRQLTYQTGIQFVGSAASGSEALRLIQEQAPDLVLMDIVMPDMNGIDATRRIKRHANAPRVVMLTLHDNAEYRYHAQLAGADGFIAKSELEVALPAMIERLFHCVAETYTPPTLKQQSDFKNAQESEARLQLALEAGEMGIFDWNLETGVVTWSAQNAKLFGLRLEQFDSTYAGFARCVHREDLPGLEQAVADARQTRGLYKHKFRVIWPDGSLHWVSGKGRFSYSTIGRAVRMTGVVMDISDAMQTIRDLNEQTARLQAIFNTDPQCIKLLDSKGIIREMNQCGLDLLGVSDSHAVIGKSLLDFILPQYHESVMVFLQSVLQGNPSALVFEVFCADGGHRWMESHATLFDSPTHGKNLILSVTLDITERKQAEQQLSFLAQHDALTGLPNRLLFTDRLQQTMIEAERHQRLAGVAFLDLDSFKNINDSLGHDIGDVALVAVAARLGEALRPGDTVARLGGDEFAIVLSDIARMEDTPMIAQRILEIFTEPFHVDGREIFISASLGITLYPIDGNDAETLLRNADTAMYRAKVHGRSTCQFYTAEMTQRANDDMALEGALRHAIARHELMLHYQPIVDLNTGHILGVEALMRWQHPQLGLISPTRFIPLAEESGLIVPLGNWALRQACEQTRVWRNAGFNDLYVAVNLSSRQFREPDLAQNIAQVLAETGVEGIHLVLELTESILLSNIENTTNMMQELDAMGVRFAVDDFGTGYSSLSYLKRFPIDVLKIDQSFVRDITTDPDDAAIVRAIITLAHSLDMRVVAEGVETREQLNFLRANQCDAMQGYYFSTPLPADQITEIITGNTQLALALAN